MATSGSFLALQTRHFVCCPQINGALYSLEEYSVNSPYKELSGPFHEHFKIVTSGSFLALQMRHFVCCPQMKGAVYSVQEYSVNSPYKELSDPFHEHSKNYAGLSKSCHKRSRTYAGMHAVVFKGHHLPKVSKYRRTKDFHCSQI